MVGGALPEAEEVATRADGGSESVGGPGGAGRAACVPVKVVAESLDIERLR